MSKSTDLSFIFEFLCGFSKSDDRSSILCRYGAFDDSIIRSNYVFAKYHDAEFAFHNNLLSRLSLNFDQGFCYSRIFNKCSIYLGYKNFDSILRVINKTGLCWSIHSSGDSGDDSFEVCVDLENIYSSVVVFSYNALSRNKISKISISYD